jgi:VanZ family protein
LPLRLLLDRHLRAALFALWVGLWLWVGYISLVPVHLPPGVSDKALHFTGYAAMSAAAVGFCHDRRRLLLCAILAAGLGGAIEIAQAFTPSRSCDPLDFLADATGAALGCLTARLWLHLVIDPLRRPARA